MGRRSLTDEDKAFLKGNYLLINGKKLAEHTGSSLSAIRNYFRSQGIIIPKDVAIKFRAEASTGRTNFTPEEDKIIRKHYLTTPIKLLGEKYLNGRSWTGIMKRLSAMGLTIPPEIIAQRKTDTLIKTGNVPQNKGVKQSEWMSKENIAKTAGTRFKKGNQPYNTKECNGVISIRKDKSDFPYKYIRISVGKWVLLQRHVWEQTNGPIPDGNIIIFRDGDSMNCELENLEMISKADNAIRNSGAINLTDGTVAFYLSVKSRKPDKELQKEFLKHPELIQLKRNQLLLNREIKKHGKS